MTPEPWSADDLERHYESTTSTETVAEMDVTFDEGRSQDNTEIRLQLILEITRCLDNPFERERMLSRLLDRLMLIFPQLDHGYILLSDETGNQLKPVALHHSSSDQQTDMTIRPVTRSIARQVLEEGKSILSVDRIGPEDHDHVIDMEYRSIMCAPLVGASRKSLGIIYIDSADVQRRFTPDDLNILTCVAILAGQSLEQESRHTARYRAVVDTAVDGIITSSDQGEIESVNSAVEILFGWSRNDLIGMNLSRLIPQASDHLARLQNGSSDSKFACEAIAEKKDQQRFPIHLSIGSFELSGNRKFTAILHDITEKKIAERQLREMNENLEGQVRDRTRSVRLLQDVAMISNEAETISDAIQETLTRICRHMKWNVGHAYLSDHEHPDKFIDSGIWTQHNIEDIAPLKKASEKALFHANQGLIGSVITTRKPNWIENSDKSSIFSRTLNSSIDSLKFALAFPVLLGKQVVAVLEFYADHAHEPDGNLLELMSNIGTQLSRVVERRRLQEELIDAVWEQQAPLRPGNSRLAGAGTHRNRHDGGEPRQQDANATVTLRGDSSRNRGNGSGNQNWCSPISEGPVPRRGRCRGTACRAARSQHEHDRTLRDRLPLRGDRHHQRYGQQCRDPSFPRGAGSSQQRSQAFASC